MTYVSYIIEDRKYARVLAESLKSIGYNVWWDINLRPDNRLTGRN